MRKFIPLLPCPLLAAALAPASARAAEEFQSALAGPDGWWLFLGEWFRSLDLIGFIMLILLVVLFGMCLDLLNHLRIGRLVPEPLLAEIQDNMANGEYERALEACEKSDCLIGQIFAAALAKTDYSFQRMEEAMRSEARIQGLVWRQWVGQFRTMGAAGFMLGLMGATVDGMRLIADLNGRPNFTLALASSFEMRAIGYNILTSLFLGTLMALVAIMVHRLCSGKLEKILLESERLGQELLDPFRPLPQEE